MAQLTALLNQYHALLWILILIGLDTILGWVSALAKGQFDWTKAVQYLETKVFPYVGGLVVLSVVVHMYPQAGIALPISYVGVAAKLIKDIVTKVAGFGVSVNFNSPPTPPAS